MGTGDENGRAREISLVTLAPISHSEALIAWSQKLEPGRQWAGESKFGPPHAYLYSLQMIKVKLYVCDILSEFASFPT